jgi:glycosyltransferase involved in cell wall biosynthesis
MARVLLIRQGHVPYDPRVRRALEALVREGHEVDVISKRIPGQPTFERLPQVTIRRLWTLERKAGKLSYLLQYALFMVMAAWLAAWLHLRRRYDMVQVHSLPDTLVFAAIVPRLLGARVVLDLMETMPEFFATRFGVAMDHGAVRTVSRAEQAAIRFADHVLTCNGEMRAAFVRRGAPARKITVILNSADEDLFDPRRFPPRPRTPGRFVMVCHGTIEERYGHDTVVRAMALLRAEIPELRLTVFGDGSYRTDLRHLVRELDLEDRVWFSEGFVPVEEMVAGVADADVGVVAMKRDIFRDLTHCNKMFDFIVMRRPQIVSRTAAVESHFDDDCFEMFASSDVEDLARAIRTLHASPERCRRLVERALAVNQPYRWPGQRRIYLDAVRPLLTGAPSERSGHHHPAAASREAETPVPPLSGPGGA